MTRIRFKGFGLSPSQPRSGRPSSKVNVVLAARSVNSSQECGCSARSRAFGDAEFGSRRDDSRRAARWLHSPHRAVDGTQRVYVVTRADAKIRYCRTRTWRKQVKPSLGRQLDNRHLRTACGVAALCC